MVPLWLFWSWWLDNISKSLDSLGNRSDMSTALAATPDNIAQPQTRISRATSVEKGLPPSLDADTCLDLLLEERLLLFLDHGFRICQASEQALAALDIPADAIGSIAFSTLLSPSHRVMFDDPSNLPVQRRAQLRHHSGAYQWYCLKYRPCDGGFLLLLEPNEEQVSMEKRLRKAEMECEYSTRERGEFLRHMSHELRTPLNAILGFARMMESGVFGEVENDTYRDYLQLIRHSGEDMLSKIVDLMDLSAIGTHYVTLKEAHTCSADIIEPAIDNVRKIAVSRDVEIMMPNEMPNLPLMADSRLLRKAIFQIAKNGVDYNIAGGRLWIETGTTSQQGYPYIRICDNGKGILPRQLTALQAALHDSCNIYANIEAYRPIGIGLTLAKEYLHLHGGDIDLTSQPEQGTQVTLYLPPGRLIADEETNTMSYCPLPRQASRPMS